MTPYTLHDAEQAFRVALDADDRDEIARLGRLVDDLERAEKAATPVPTLHASALWYAEQGLKVFPLSPGSKFPFKGSGGCLDASNDVDMVNRWWTGNPNANIGLATGHIVDVVDIDGALGQASRAQHWGDIFGAIDSDGVGKVLTPRPGGMHIYVPATGDGNSTGIVPGVDYRGIGGYVLAPPSKLIAGACKPTDTPGSYRWLGTPALTTLQSVA